MEEQAAKRLEAKPIDTTGDMFDPTAAENPLFASPTPGAGKSASLVDTDTGRSNIKGEYAEQGNPTGSQKNAQGEIQVLAEDVGRGAEAVRRVSPDASDFRSQFQALLEIAEQRGLILPSAFVPDAFEASGQEHNVWFSADKSRVYKANPPAVAHAEPLGKAISYQCRTIHPAG